MKNVNIKRVTMALSILLLAACSGDDGAAGAQGPAGSQGPQGEQGTQGEQGEQGPSGGFGAYSIVVTNLTHGQPMAPTAIVVHEPGYNMFVSSESATLGLESLAEGGSPAMLISEAQDSKWYLDAVNTDGINGPGASTSLTTVLVPELDIDNVQISVATMLVDTNDAFAGINAKDISNMGVGESKVFLAPVWDAGTEANTETAATMPGPAANAAGGGGAAAGFNSTRDDLIDAVRIHAGVVTMENASNLGMEGLITSVLNQSDRFDNPAAKIVITRTR